MMEDREALAQLINLNESEEPQLEIPVFKSSKSMSVKSVQPLKKPEVQKASPKVQKVEKLPPIQEESVPVKEKSEQKSARKDKRK